jgi:exopolysaccharide biosynthesis protein
MKRFLSKPYWWTIVYTLLLTGFTAFVLLDTFVIPRAISAAPAVEYVQNDNVVASTAAPSSMDTEKDSAGAAADGPVYTANSYKDENISITITTERLYDTQVYIADIQLRSLDYLKTAFARNTFGRNIAQKTSVMAEAHDAILAINGDYCGFRNTGFVIRNGVLYRAAARSRNDDEALVIYGDGSFGVVSENAISADALKQKGAIQVFSFGPSLLKNGVIDVNESSEVAKAKTSNPRTAIGIISPLHYIIIVSDGRMDQSTGLTLYQLAEIFQEQGCEIAYNFDGGGSSAMWFNGRILNVPTDGVKLGERKVSDIVFIGY